MRMWVFALALRASAYLKPEEWERRPYKLQPNECDGSTADCCPPGEAVPDEAACRDAMSAFAHNVPRSIVGTSTKPPGCSVTTVGEGRMYWNSHVFSSGAPPTTSATFSPGQQMVCLEKISSIFGGPVKMGAFPKTNTVLQSTYKSIVGLLRSGRQALGNEVGGQQGEYGEYAVSLAGRATQLNLLKEQLERRMDVCRRLEQYMQETVKKQFELSNGTYLRNMIDSWFPSMNRTMAGKLKDEEKFQQSIADEHEYMLKFIKDNYDALDLQIEAANLTTLHKRKEMKKTEEAMMRAWESRSKILVGRVFALRQWLSVYSESVLSQVANLMGNQGLARDTRTRLNLEIAMRKRWVDEIEATYEELMRRRQTAVGKAEGWWMSAEDQDVGGKAVRMENMIHDGITAFMKKLNQQFSEPEADNVKIREEAKLTMGTLNDLSEAIEVLSDKFASGDNRYRAKLNAIVRQVSTLTKALGKVANAGSRKEAGFWRTKLFEAMSDAQGNAADDMRAAMNIVQSYSDRTRAYGKELVSESLDDTAAINKRTDTNEIKIVEALDKVNDIAANTSGASDDLIGAQVEARDHSDDQNKHWQAHFQDYFDRTEAVKKDIALNESALTAGVVADAVALENLSASELVEVDAKMTALNSTLHTLGGGTDSRHTYLQQNIAAEMKNVQNASRRTGSLANAILPALKAYAIRKLWEENGISSLEQNLQDATMQSVLFAAGLEQQLGNKMSVDMKKLIEGAKRDLKAEENKQKDELHTLGSAVADRWLVVDAKAHDQTKAANATLGLAESVGDQIDADHSKYLQQFAETSTRAGKSFAGMENVFKVAVARARKTLDDALARAEGTTAEAWSSHKGTQVDTVKEKAAAGQKANRDLKDQTEAEISQDAFTWGGDVTGAHNSAQQLDAKIRGVAANATQWRKGIDNELSGAAAAAHRDAIANAEDILVRQAAIEKKFRTIQSKVLADVDGASAEERLLISKMTEKMKRQYNTIAENTALGAKEKAALMQQADELFADDVRKVREELSSGSSEMTNAKAQGYSVNRIAEKRATRLADQLAAQVTQDPSQDQEEMEHVEVGLAELMDSVLKRMDAVDEHHATTLRRQGEDHTEEAGKMRTEVLRAFKDTARELQRADTTADSALASLEQKAGRHVESVEDTIARMRLVVEHAQGAVDRLHAQVADYARLRSNRQGELNKWMQSSWEEGAEMLEKSAHSIARTLESAHTNVEMRRKAVAAHVERLEESLSMPGGVMSALEKLQLMNESLATMGEKREEHQDWIRTWTNATQDWRRAVTKSFTAAAEKLRDTDLAMAQAGGRFKDALEKTGAELQGAAAARMRGVMDQQEHDIGRTETSSAASIGKLSRKLEADAASDEASFKVLSDQAGGLSADTATTAAAKRLQEKLDSQRNAQLEAFDAAHAVITSSQDELDEVRGRLHGKLDDIGEALGMPPPEYSVLQLDSSDVQDLRTNLRLAVEHRNLEKEVRELQHARLTTA